MKNSTYNEDFIEKIPADIHNSGTVSLNVRSYAGYAKSKYQGNEAQLFYWFFESQKFSPKFSRDEKEIGKTPLIIWLNGGPGAPSTFGLFLENGPYRIQDGSVGELIENKYSWNKDAHIIYWDQPIGTGYSYCNDDNNHPTYAKNEDELSEMLYHALQDFLTKHSEYRSCPVYVTGESYAGKYVPNIALKIHNKNKEISDKNKRIHLKGIAVGDGWIDARLQIKIYIDYAHTLGYIDKKQKDDIDKNYLKFCAALDKSDWNSAYKISNDIVEDVSAMGGNFNIYDIRSFSGIPMDNLSTYMELPELKKVLHVAEEQKWECADNVGPVANNLIEDNMVKSNDVYSEIIKQDDLYKVLMYTGTFDTACGPLSTESILYDLKKWSNSEDEIWKDVNRDIWAQPHTNVKGFIKQFKNLTQIVIPNSGHQVPYYKPEISREMLYKWINDEKFPAYSPLETVTKHKLEKIKTNKQHITKSFLNK